MAQIKKETFVSGFVPHHTHGSVDYTSVEQNHIHQCLDVTSPPHHITGVDMPAPGSK